ncbi:MAG TPA: Rieske (2Fe-2S) protein [Gemmataceae bacterium]|nr:Rieske (2Fe-2S) protein [Gemmataceae bacterium]
MSERDGEAADRRDFLGGAAKWTTVATLGFAAIGITRMPKPGVMPGKSSAIKIGPLGDYPVSSDPVRVPGQNLFVVHDHDGFASMSAVCSHLGCIVAATPEGFACPCHGSRFARDGKVTQGPAPSPLNWYEVTLAPDGQVVVDTKRTVPVGTKFKLS